MNSNEPTVIGGMILGILTGAIGVAAAFGLRMTAPQQEAVQGLLVLIVAAVTFLVRQHVVPLGKAQAAVARAKAAVPITGVAVEPRSTEVTMPRADGLKVHYPNLAPAPAPDDLVLARLFEKLFTSNNRSIEYTVDRFAVNGQLTLTPDEFRVLQESWPAYQRSLTSDPTPTPLIVPAP